MAQLPDPLDPLSQRLAPSDMSDNAENAVSAVDTSDKSRSQGAPVPARTAPGLLRRDQWLEEAGTRPFRPPSPGHTVPAVQI